MKNHIIYLTIILALASCSRNNSAPGKPTSPLAGNWGFLDKQGNYNEAYFSDSTYVTFNRSYGIFPTLNYRLRNDSMYANVDKEKRDVLKPIVKLEWLNRDKVVFLSEFSRDTLERINDNKMTLENTSLKKDSLAFRLAYEGRFGDFLVKRGIISRHEADSMYTVIEAMFER